MQYVTLRCHPFEYYTLQRRYCIAGHTKVRNWFRSVYSINPWTLRLTRSFTLKYSYCKHFKRNFEMWLRRDIVSVIWKQMQITFLTMINLGKIIHLCYNDSLDGLAFHKFWIWDPFYTFPEKVQADAFIVQVWNSTPKLWEKNILQQGTVLQVHRFLLIFKDFII